MLVQVCEETFPLPMRVWFRGKELVIGYEPDQHTAPVAVLLCMPLKPVYVYLCPYWFCKIVRSNNCAVVPYRHGLLLCRAKAWSLHATSATKSQSFFSIVRYFDDAGCHGSQVHRRLRQVAIEVNTTAQLTFEAMSEMRIFDIYSLTAVRFHKGKGIYSSNPTAGVVPFFLGSEDLNISPKAPLGRCLFR